MVCTKEIIHFGLNIMEEIFEIGSCIEILANDIKIYSIDQHYVLQLITALQKKDAKNTNCGSYRV